MIKCPKCGFEQPRDVFCAKCGVNMQNYHPPLQTLVAGLSRSFKSFLVVVLILLACYFVLKSFEKIIHSGSAIKYTDIGNSTQLGVSAGSLASGEKKEAAEEASPAEEVPQDAVAATHTEKTATEKKFDQVTANISIGEAAYNDFMNDIDGNVANNPAAPNRKWHVVTQVNPVNTFINQEMTLKKGPNTFVFDDNIVRIDVSFVIDDITEKEIDAHINYRRSLKAYANQNETIDISQKIPLSDNLVLVDSIPRQLRLTRADTILSTLFHSQAFLSRSSEMVQIIKFENPRTVPQE
jgi:hypothetical protein